jgi:hypothetical protein
MVESAQALFKHERFALSWCEQKETTRCGQKENNALGSLRAERWLIFSVVASAEDSSAGMQPERRIKPGKRQAGLLHGGLACPAGASSRR